MTSQSQNQRPAPDHAVGDWVFDNHHGHNVRIVSVSWDPSLNGFTGGWRYSVPGLNSPRMYPEEPHRPYRRYEKIAENCYRDDGLCARDDL